MPYERSFQIEKRLESMLRLIESGRYSTPLLAERLGVSIPTVSRYVNALRDRGHKIRSKRTPDGWRYILARTPARIPRHAISKFPEGARAT